MKDYGFSITLSVRASDLNYGAHVGYQQYFSYFQEARIAYLDQWTYSELDIEGRGLIVAEANCRYKRELFLSDAIEVGCRISEIKKKSFIFQYCIERAGKVCAEGFTKNLCFDYKAKKVVSLPENFVQSARAFEAL